MTPRQILEMVSQDIDRAVWDAVGGLMGWRTFRDLPKSTVKTIQAF
jgi:hypothetical protein